MSVHVRADDEPRMRALGAALARVLEPGSVIHLGGTLGAGKTTLARALIQALVPGARVKSPSYALIESYPEASPPIHHLDLYRIESSEELEFLGLRELADDGAALLVEWPERGAGHVPAPDLEIAIAVAGETRELALRARSGRGERMLAGLERAEASVPR